MMTILVTSYLTGLIVCLTYDIMLAIEKNSKPPLPWWGIILDELFWPITLFILTPIALITLVRLRGHK